MKVCTTCGKEWPDDTKFCPDDGSTLRSTEGTIGDLVGTVIGGRYHITKKLGEGGMGAVYLGEHVKMGRMSAIKVMTESMAHDADAIARFNREAANAARINHANVCGIYDFGETEEGLIYLAMEFIEGEALTDLLDREGALAPKRAADILKQATDALQAAHDLGIVHRDIKPDNIMISRSKDGRDIVKVVDFGIAKAVGPEEGQNVTKTGLVVGTPEYMSPEQLSGDVLDGRSDVYSIALVLYRMLTGTLPFQADSAQETMIKRLTDDPMPLDHAMPSASFPPALQAALDKALQRMPADRYEACDVFGREVEQAVSGMSDADVAPVADAEGATMLMDSAEIADQAAAGGEVTEQVPATRVAGAEAAPRAHTPETPQPVAAPEAGVPAVAKKSNPMIAVAAVVGVLVVGGGGYFVMAGGEGEVQPPAEPVASGQDNGNDGEAGTDQGVTGTTDPAPGGDNDSRPQGGDPPAQGDPTTTTQADPQTTDPGSTDPAEVDGRASLTQASAEVTRAAEGIMDMIDPDADLLDQYRGALLSVYNNPTFPDSLRARAADAMLESYVVEGSQAGSCRWLQNAIRYGKQYDAEFIESLRC